MCSRRSSIDVQRRVTATLLPHVCGGCWRHMTPRWLRLEVSDITGQICVGATAFWLASQRSEPFCAAWYSREAKYTIQNTIGVHNVLPRVQKYSPEYRGTRTNGSHTCHETIRTLKSTAAKQYLRGATLVAQCLAVRAAPTRARGPASTQHGLAH